MPQTADIDLVRQTLVNRLQSPYGHQREEAKAAIAAFDRIVPFIMPTLELLPDGYEFAGLSYDYSLELWKMTMLTARASRSARNLDEYGNSPRDAFDACREKLERWRTF